MTLAVVRDATTVDCMIDRLGSWPTSRSPVVGQQADAMILVLGDRLDGEEIRRRWSASPAVLAGALSARAWLVGDADELVQPSA